MKFKASLRDIKRQHYLYKLAYRILVNFKLRAERRGHGQHTATAGDSFEVFEGQNGGLGTHL